MGAKVCEGREEIKRVRESGPISTKVTHPSPGLAFPISFELEQGSHDVYTIYLF